MAGCVDGGDFGRPRAGVWNDAILPAAGSLAAFSRGEPVSRYVFTDDEEELRNRAWRFLMPAHERAWFDRRLANLVRTRILPVSARPDDIASYHRALMRDGGRSPVSRYRRLSEDMIADAKLIGPFAVTSLRVIKADEVRLRSLAYVGELSKGNIRNAAARVAENRCLIAWVRLETASRVETYRYSLEHLVIEAPLPQGIAVERALVALSRHRTILDGLPVASEAVAACGGDVAEAVVLLPPLEPLQPLVVKD